MIGYEEMGNINVAFLGPGLRGYNSEFVHETLSPTIRMWRG